MVAYGLYRSSANTVGRTDYTMKIIDITRTLSGAAVSFPGDPPPQFSQRDAGLYLISDLHMNSHSGTHIDAPVHYLKTGDTIDTIPLDHLIGPCRVLDMSRAGEYYHSSRSQRQAWYREAYSLKNDVFKRSPVPGGLPASVS